MRMTLFTLLFILSACASKLPPLKQVSHVDISRYMGTWYVIASIPTIFEKGGTDAVETYTWNEKEKRIDVKFNMLKKGQSKKYTQKAWVYNKSGSEWRIQFFWPLKFAYLILDLDEQYTYTVVGVPNRDHVWIMSRQKTMPHETYLKILSKLKEQNFNVSKIELVPQSSSALK